MLWCWVRRLIKVREATFIMTSSDAYDSIRSDYLIYLRKGRIIEQGTPKGMLERYKLNDMDDLITKIAIEDEKALRENPELLKTAEDIDKLATGVEKLWRKEELDELFPPATDAWNINHMLVLEKRLVALRNMKLYIFVGLLIPLICLTLYYIGISQQLSNAKVGISKFLVPLRNIHVKPFFSPQNLAYRATLMFHMYQN